jgi:hypothetical protein
MFIKLLVSSSRYPNYYIAPIVNCYFEFLKKLKNHSVIKNLYYKISVFLAFG